MTTEELRHELLTFLDDTLAHTWLVTGEKKRLLAGLRAYLLTASEVELSKLLSLLPPEHHIMTEHEMKAAHPMLAHPCNAHLMDAIAGPTAIIASIRKFFGDAGASQVGGAIEKARTAGVPWLQILAAILPLLLSLFTGGGIDVAALVAAIMALIKS